MLRENLGGTWEGHPPCPTYFYVLCICDLGLYVAPRLHIHPVSLQGLAPTLEEPALPRPLVSSCTGTPARLHGLGSQLVGGVGERVQARLTLELGEGRG